METVLSYCSHILVWSGCAVPPCLLMIWMTEGGDCPFRSPLVIVKCFGVWLAVFLVIPIFGFFGPIGAMAGGIVMLGFLLDWTFERGFWISAWWATGTFAIWVLLLLFAQLVFGRYGFGVM